MTGKQRPVSATFFLFCKCLIHRITKGYIEVSLYSSLSLQVSLARSQNSGVQYGYIVAHSARTFQSDSFTQAQKAKN